MASKMAADLLTQITNQFSPQSVNQIASVVGETPAKTQTVLSSLVPVVLGTLATKASSTEGANGVIDLIRNNNLTSINVEDLSGPGATTVTNTGRSLVDSLFGFKMNSIGDWISSKVGVNRASVMSLASLAIPAILGLVGRRLGNGGLNASSLRNLLGSPNNYLQNVPAELASAIGLTGGATGARQVAENTERRVTAVPAYAAQKAGSVWKWLLPLLLVVGLLGLIAYVLSNRQQPSTAVESQVPARTEAPAPVAPAPVAAAPAPATDLGAFIDTKLPDGVSLHIPSNGVENKLLSFIGDSTKAVDKTTWFSFDRLEFETGSAKLKLSSQEQVGNMVKILKAYPQVNLKIGGYTDNTGNDAQNLKLSQDRAMSTRNAMVSQGIDGSRLEAEGYGQQFPVADNATAEGRQRNRRIDIRVTQK